MIAKKIVFSISLLISLFAFSCSKATKEDASPKQEQKIEAPATQETSPTDTYTMKIGHAQAETSPRHRSLLLFKEEVEKRTEGKIKVELYPQGLLGDETEMTVAVSEGRLEAVRGGDLEFVPKSQLLGLPMIADTLEEARSLCYSGFVQDMLSEAENSNMLVLAVGDDSGFRQITNSVRPIAKPGDMKGLKIRAPQIVATVNFINELGAQATVVPFTELYDALKNKRVSGQENPLALIDSSKFYEVQSYCTIIDYQFFPELMYVNKTWLNALPKEYKEILRECAKDMMQENARITDEENEAYIKHIEANGCKVIKLSEAERDAFLPYAERVWEKYVDEGYASSADIKELLSLVDKTVEW